MIEAHFNRADTKIKSMKKSDNALSYGIILILI